jgi:hypothetical protein
MLLVDTAVSAFLRNTFPRGSLAAKSPGAPGPTNFPGAAATATRRRNLAIGRQGLKKDLLASKAGLFYRKPSQSGGLPVS